ncbi:MAG: Mov34/MPN/PAD-1 family protein [Bacteroidetes bacterium]|nr:Mov34/MPN/PAD-1 family protein [Bacteroidota bacterium]
MEVKIGDLEVAFSDGVLAIMDQHAQVKSSAPEQGGILLGRAYKNRFVVEKISTPTELDKCSRYNFERHRLSAQMVINYEFFNSNGQVMYLGEWHTHPEDNPTPSGVDLKMIKSQLAKNKIDVPYLLLVIKGRKTTYIGLQTSKELFSITF